ncbi:MAG: hypothetical protein FWH24_04925 [Oscillospiraceae bacterium]|nr:hypothetical protein [Oscillospiraceae bacterium]
MKNKNLCLLFVLMLILTSYAAAACGTTEQHSDSPPEEIGAGTEPGDDAEEVPAAVLDLPDVDMEGRVFTFLTSNWPEEAVWTVTDILGEDELTGESLNDAIYLRNREVEARFNLEIKEINVDSCNDATALLSRAVRAQEEAYDLWLSRLGVYQSVAAQGSLFDLHKLEHTNFSNPWWDSNSARELSIAGRLFAVCGDITTMDNAATTAIVFNKGLLADYGLADPYQLVKSGEWTLDSFMGLVREVSLDLNGDGTMDENDRFGFLYQRDTLLTFFAGSGELFARKDENDIPYLTITEEGAVNQMLRVLDMLYERDSCYNVMFLPGDFNIGMDLMFQNNQGLFMWLRMANIVALRTMPTDFGILPTPKRDASQEHYTTDVNSWTGVALTVPVTNTDYENTGIFLEALAEASNRLVQPAYRDRLLDNIIARDDESLEMLDIIFSNRTFDIGAIGRFGELRDVLWETMTFNTNIASWLESRINRAERDIERLIEKIEEFD